MAASPALPIIPSDIVVFTGPLLLGHLFNWALFGVLSLQVYLYYIAFPHDRWIPKTIVAVTYALEVIQVILATRDAFRVFGSGWGNLSEWDKIGWQWFSVPAFVVIIGSISQLFYAWRIWVLGGKMLVPIVVASLSLLQFVAGMWGAIVTERFGKYSLVQDSASKPTGVWLAGTALCDMVIASSMFFYLKRPNTRMKSTSTLLSRIIRVTVETGLLCATFAITDFILFMIFRHNNIHVPLCSSLGKLYSNSLLAVLNARIRISGGRKEAEVPTDISLSIMTESDSDHPRTKTFSVFSTNVPRMSFVPPPSDAKSIITFDDSTVVDSV